MKIQKIKIKKSNEINSDIEKVSIISGNNKMGMSYSLSSLDLKKKIIKK